MWTWCVRSYWPASARRAEHGVSQFACAGPWSGFQAVRELSDARPNGPCRPSTRRRSRVAEAGNPTPGRLDSTTAMKLPWRTLRAWLGTLLFLAALVYVGLKLESHLDGLASSAASVGALALVGAILCTMASLVFQAWYHLLVLERLSEAPVPRARVLASYFRALLVRYLPGKFWGLVYQSHYLAAHARSVHVVLANVFQTLMSLLLTAAVAGIVLVAMVHSPFWLAALLPVLLFIELLHRRPSIEMATLAFLAKWFPSLKLARESHMRPLRWPFLLRSSPCSRASRLRWMQRFWVSGTLELRYSARSLLPCPRDLACARQSSCRFRIRAAIRLPCSPSQLSWPESCNSPRSWHLSC